MFADIVHQQNVVRTLQKSLETGRLAHASLFVGSSSAEMEEMVIALAQTLHCENPPARSEKSGMPLDACGKCRNCNLIAERKYPDVQWIYPESKIRIITTEQIRKLIASSQLKSSSGNYEISVISSADRLNTQAANAFLKTLEEPVPGKIFILLTHDAQKIIPTILSRCRRIIFEGINRPSVDSETRNWLWLFAQTAASSESGLLSRYTLLTPMVEKLAELKQNIEGELRKESPLYKYKEKYTNAEERIDSSIIERWEKELQSTIASEYRKQRAEMLAAIELWLRDIWMIKVSNQFPEDSFFPDLKAYSEMIASHISEKQARENLKTVSSTMKILDSNVQEELILEVFLLKLAL